MNKILNQKILLSPWVILLSIILGTTIGITHKPLAQLMSPLGNIYVSMLQMCILPIIITAIVSSLGNLLHTGIASAHIRRMLLIFIVGLAAASIFALLIGALGKPGANLSETAKLLLSHQISKTETASYLADSTPTETANLIHFFNNMVPQNVFHSMNQGNILAVLFFCITLGIALGKTNSSGAKTTLAVLDAIFSALLKIVSWIMYGLPLGLFFLFAGYASRIGLGELAALGRLLILFYCAAFLMAVTYSLIIWRQAGGSYFNSLRALKAPLMVAFGTSSSFAAIPSMIEGLEKNLRMDRRLIDLIVPLGINLNRHGSILRLVLVAVFITQLYGQPLNFANFTIIFITSILAGIASSGLPGIASVSILALILEPLGLPTSVGIVLLTAIAPITDPASTLVNVYGNCAAATLLAKHSPISHPAKSLVEPLQEDEYLTDN